MCIYTHMFTLDNTHWFVLKRELNRENYCVCFVLKILNKTYEKCPASSHPQRLNRVSMNVRHGMTNTFLGRQWSVWNLIRIAWHYHRSKSVIFHWPMEMGCRMNSDWMEYKRKTAPSKRWRNREREKERGKKSSELRKPVNRSKNKHMQMQKCHW